VQGLATAGRRKNLDQKKNIIGGRGGRSEAEPGAARAEGNAQIKRKNKID
jgi:hypothetical protein